MVDFEFLNLVGDEYPTLFSRTNAMDLILCRNVLMYFRPDIITQVVGRLQRSLLDGGWLVVSPVESPLINYPGTFDSPVPRCLPVPQTRSHGTFDHLGGPGREGSREGPESLPGSRTTARPPSQETGEKAYAQALASFAAAQYDACVSLLGDPALGWVRIRRRMSFLPGPTQTQGGWRMPRNGASVPSGQTS